MRRERFPIPLDKGQHEGLESSVLGVGWLKSCRNWIPEPTGGLRARRGWVKASGTGAPTTRKGWGIGHLAVPRRPGKRQFIVGTSVTSSPVAESWGKATVAGSTLVAILHLGNGSSATVTPPTVTGNPWTLAKRQDNGITTGVAIYYIENANSQSGSSSWGVSSVTDGVTLWLIELINVPTSGVLDKTASTSGTGATGSTGTTPALSQAVAYAVSIISANQEGAGGAHSAQTNGFTEISEVESAGASEAGGAISEKVVTDGTATGHSDTISGVDNGWAGAVAVFKAADFTATDGDYVVANNAGASQLDIYRIDREDLAGGSWEQVESLAVAPDVAPVAYTSGLGALLYTHPSFSSARRWRGRGTTPEALTGSPAGRCIAFHNQRVWIAGTLVRQSDLFYSAVGDATSWDTSEPVGDWLPINRDDGEAVEDIVPFGDGLLIAKQTSLWYLTGNGKQDFDLRRVGQAGAAPGRTLMPTSIGAIIAGRKHVWLWDGTAPDIISKPIESTYGLTGNWLSVAQQDNVVYILDEGSGTIWCLDIVSGSWHTETLGSSGDAPSCLYNQDFRLLAAPKNATSAWGTILAYREFPGTARDKDFDSLSEAFEFQTADLPLAGPGFGLSPRYLHLRLRQRGGNENQTPLTFTPYYDGVAQATQMLKPRSSTGIYAEPITLPEGGYMDTFGFALSQTLPSGEHAVFDIEEPHLECDIQDRRG